MSGGTELTPLGENGGAVGLEGSSAGKAVLLVEMVERRGVNGWKTLRRSHAPEAEHHPLPPSKRSVRILLAIVRLAAGFVEISRSDFPYRGAIGVVVDDETVMHRENRDSPSS